MRLFFSNFCRDKIYFLLEHIIIFIIISHFYLKPFFILLLHVHNDNMYFKYIGWKFYLQSFSKSVKIKRIFFSGPPSALLFSLLYALVIGTSSQFTRKFSFYPSLTLSFSLSLYHTHTHTLEHPHALFPSRQADTILQLPFYCICCYVV